MTFAFRASLAQPNVVKARAIVFPIIFGYAYSAGIGYERLINDRLSGQILLNSYGYSTDATDGDTES